MLPPILLTNSQYYAILSNTGLSNNALNQGGDLYDDDATQTMQFEFGLIKTYIQELCLVSIVGLDCFVCELSEVTLLISANYHCNTSILARSVNGSAWTVMVSMRLILWSKQ